LNDIPLHDQTRYPADIIPLAETNTDVRHTVDNTRCYSP
jgi:hypothetical protein